MSGLPLLSMVKNMQLYELFFNDTAQLKVACIFD